METASLVGAMEKWLFAIECEEFDLARTIAKDMISDGTHLARHADFDPCLRKHFSDDDPEALLRTVGAFLACVADAREQAVRGRTRSP